MAGIFYMSSKPPEEVPGLVKHFVGAYLRGDSGAHFLAYAALATAFIWTLGPYFRRARWSIALAWLTSSAYGAINECHQLFVPERSASVWELLIDSFGALAACVAWTGLYLMFKQRRGAVAAPQEHPKEESGGTAAPNPQDGCQPE